MFLAIQRKEWHHHRTAGDALVGLVATLIVICVAFNCENSINVFSLSRIAKIQTTFSIQCDEWTACNMTCVHSAFCNTAVGRMHYYIQLQKAIQIECQRDLCFQAYTITPSHACSPIIIVIGNGNGNEWMDEWLMDTIEQTWGVRCDRSFRYTKNMECW